MSFENAKKKNFLAYLNNQRLNSNMSTQPLLTFF